MAKQNKENATDKKDSTEVAGTVSPDNKAATPQVDNQEMQTPSVLTETGAAGSVASGDSEQGSGDSASTSGGEDSEMDSQPKEKGTGEQGGDTASEIKLTEKDLPRHSHDPEKVFSNDEAWTDKPAEPKADTEKRLRIAADIFKKNDRVDVLHFTSDFTPFFKENDAIKHTRTGKLADKTIISITKQ